jgi:outer membrane protein assembly factor BamB
VGAPTNQPGSTVAIDASTGELRWRSGHGEAGYSSARVFDHDGKRVVAMFKGEGLSIFNATDGKELFFYPTTARDFGNSLTPVFVGERILVSNTGSQPAALLDWTKGSSAATQPVWTHSAFALLFNNAVVQGNSIFGFNEQKRGTAEFTCIDANSGETRWVSNSVGIGTFIEADGRWIFLTRQGELVLAPISEEGLKPVAKFQALGGKSYATPALAQGKIFVRNNEGDLAAYDLSKSNL